MERGSFDQGPLDGRQVIYFLGQPLSSNMQSSLDGTHRGIKIVAHFDQRAALDVKRLQGLAIHRAQSIQTFANLSRTLALHHVISRKHPVHANRVVALLSKIFSLACLCELRDDNPARVPKNPQKRRETFLNG